MIYTPLICRFRLFFMPLLLLRRYAIMMPPLCHWLFHYYDTPLILAFHWCFAAYCLLTLRDDVYDDDIIIFIRLMPPLLLRYYWLTLRHYISLSFILSFSSLIIIYFAVASLLLLSSPLDGLFHYIVAAYAILYIMVGSSYVSEEAQAIGIKRIYRYAVIGEIEAMMMRWWK